MMNGELATGKIAGFDYVFAPGRDEDAGSDRTLLLLHGTGGDEYDLLGLGRALAPGAALLSPRGRVLEGRLNRFFHRLAEGVFDVEDVKRRAFELADFVGAAAMEYGFDPAKVDAAGFSNGANIAAALLLLRPGVVTSAALFAAMRPLQPDSAANLAGTSVFLGAGRIDPIAPPEETDRLADLLRRAGADVEVYYHAGGHQLTPPEVDAASQWLASRGG